MNRRTGLRVVIDAMTQRAGEMVPQKPFLEALAMEDMHALEFTDFVSWKNRLQAHDTVTGIRQMSRQPGPVGNAHQTK